MNMKKRNRKAAFHLGVDYAVVMLGDENTENATIRLYGTSEEVEFYGKIIEHAINEHAELPMSMRLR